MNRFLIALLCVLAIIYIAFEYKGLQFYGVGIKSIFLLILLLLYYLTVKSKKLLFSLFLIIFTIGEIVYFSTWYMEDKSWNTFYFVTNLLYILAYIFLIASIMRYMNFKVMLKSYPVQMVILAAMSVFCVIYISYSAEFHLAPLEFLLEILYNSIIMTLLSISLLNYVMKQDSKAMTLLIGSILMVFSEMLQYANNYVAEFTLLRIISSVFSILAFGLFFTQAKLAPESEFDYLLESEIGEI